MQNTKRNVSEENNSTLTNTSAHDTGLDQIISDYVNSGLLIYKARALSQMFLSYLETSNASVDIIGVATEFTDNLLLLIQLHEKGGRL